MSEWQSFRLTDEGRAIVPVFIKQYDGKILEKVFFKVDTGADVTTISKSDLITDIGYPATVADMLIMRNKTFRRAGKHDEHSHCIISPVINFSGRDFRYWPLHVEKDKHDDFPNLLGLDILTHFVFKFDYETGFAYFKPIQTPAIVLPKMKDEEPELLKTNPEISRQEVYEFSDG